MSLFKFDDDDLFINTLRTHPEYQFYIQGGTIYLDGIPAMSGANLNNILGTTAGYMSLYEYNIDRPAGQNIYPFVIKSGKKDSFKKIKKSTYMTNYSLGDVVSSSYNMSASIVRHHFKTTTRNRIKALKNVFNHYAINSPHYQYSSTLGNKEAQDISLISIPSIMYGSKIKKGSVNLRYYISGSLIGELSDKYSNGELIQTGPVGSTGSGSVAGVVLYNEGIVCLTGSWSLDSHTISYDTTGNSKWLYFGYGANDGNAQSTTTVSASYYMQYSGTVDIPTMTMLAHANYGELNYSTNPTFLSSSNTFSKTTGSHHYVEQPSEIENIVYSTFNDKKPKFEKTVYISKIGIYDENKNLIAIAKLATPIRKTEANQYTFKLKLDL